MPKLITICALGGLTTALLGGSFVWINRDIPTAYTALTKVTDRPLSREHDTKQACKAGDFLFVSAALRNDGEGWFAIEDEAHTPINVERVVTNAFEVEVYYTFEADKIASLVVSPDEALASNSVSAGASVGPSKATLTITRNGKRVSPFMVNTSRYPNSNLWLHGTFLGNC